MGKIVICGDSFAIGIGCNDLKTQPFGQLLGNKYGKEVLNFAKGSSTNYSIALQVEYVLENVQDIDLLLINQTCNHRINFFKEDEQLKRAGNTFFNNDITNLDINYHEYPPYGEGTYHQVLDHPYKDHPDYKGILNTENFYGVLTFENKYADLRDSPYYTKFFGEHYFRIKLLKDYYNELWDDRIQYKYDISILLYCHIQAKRKGVKHLMLVDWPELLELIDPEYACRLSWGDLALEFPDTIGSWHTSEQGHEKAFQIVVDTLEINSKI
jgi:hypothetical protein